MKIFVSTPMNGLTDEEILSDHEKVVAKLREMFGNDVEITWSFDTNWPEGAGRLWGWGRGLMAMDGCDIYCNVTNMREPGVFNGCEVERIAANIAGMSMLELNMDDLKEEIQNEQIQDTPVES